MFVFEFSTLYIVECSVLLTSEILEGVFKKETIFTEFIQPFFNLHVGVWENQ